MRESVLEPGILLSSLRGFTATPSVVAGTRNLENSTRDSDRPDRLLRVDELVPHEFLLRRRPSLFLVFLALAADACSHVATSSAPKVLPVVSRPGFPPPASTSACRTPTPHSCFRQIHFTANDADALFALRHRRTTSALYSNAKGIIYITGQQRHDLIQYWTWQEHIKPLEKPTELDSLSTNSTPRSHRIGCPAWFEQVRWPDGRACPRCGNAETTEAKNGGTMPLSL